MEKEEYSTHIETDFIRLQELLKYEGLCETGGDAKIRIQSGDVKVNGKICTQRGKKLHIGDCICIDDITVSIK